MKALATAFFLSFIPGVNAAPVKAIDEDRMIAVLAEVEGGQWGQNGGACQISYIAWSQHSRFAYQLSRHREHALPVYRLHLRWIIEAMRRIDRTPTPHDIGVAWRWGFERARSMKWKSEYGDRCENLYRDSSFKNTIP